MKILFALHPPIIVVSISAYLSWYHIIFILGVIIMIFDILARYKEYLFITNCSSDKKKMSMIKHMKSSWCTRTVAKYSYHPASSYYKKMGYKWYHIFPDNFHKRIFTFRFWLSLLGIKNNHG